MLYEHVCRKQYDIIYVITVNVSYFARFQIDRCLHPGEGNGRRNMQMEKGPYCSVMSVVCASVGFVHERSRLIVRKAYHQVTWWCGGTTCSLHFVKRWPCKWRY